MWKMRLRVCIRMAMKGFSQMEKLLERSSRTLQCFMLNYNEKKNQSPIRISDPETFPFYCYSTCFLKQVTYSYMCNRWNNIKCYFNAMQHPKLSQKIKQHWKFINIYFNTILKLKMNFVSKIHFPLTILLLGNCTWW